LRKIIGKKNFLARLIYGTAEHDAHTELTEDDIKEMQKEEDFDAK
jgi:hypothetical protein